MAAIKLDAGVIEQHLRFHRRYLILARQILGKAVPDACAIGVVIHQAQQRQCGAHQDAHGKALRRQLFEGVFAQRFGTFDVAIEARQVAFQRGAFILFQATIAE